MNKNKLLILFILRILIFGLFMMSGILKLFPSIVPFEKQLVDLGLVNWCSSPYMARFIIALELALGIAFLQSNYLKKIVIPATVILLIVFCVHLSIVIYTQGANSGNCGCFGQLIPMTPLEALIKNVFTLGILGYMYVIYKEKEKNNFLVLTTVYLVSTLAVFVLYPFKPCQTIVVEETIDEVITLSSDSTKKETSSDVLIKDSLLKSTSVPTMEPNKIVRVDDSVKKVPLAKVDVLCPVKKTSVYASFKKFNDGISTNLDEGRKIVTLFSLDCEHCMETAKKIGELSKKRSMPPTFFLFWGTEDQVENFFRVAQCRFPYKIIEPTLFFQLLGSAPSPPKVTYLCNGNILSEYDNTTFKIEKLEEMLNK
ncbi:MAG TPA: MauE/DoxX family redox-associated membrane protein [Cytophagaceae bacterium]|jgi:hypothetical protein|nr:MauE/DoxX family redox-associated membrane protein [Cytophagaceae bacterium]